MPHTPKPLLHRLMMTAAVIAAAVWQTQPAHAWGPDGHRIVCAIAWDEMRPKTQQGVFDLLQINNH